VAPTVAPEPWADAMSSGAPGDFDAPQHGEVLDAQYDASASARRLATAHADGTVCVWNTESRECKELCGHKAAPIALAWSSGRFAGLLASGSEDGQVILWREVRQQEWQVTYQVHVTGSANVLSFCPPDHGLVLAVAGGDEVGVVTLIMRPETSSGNFSDQWQSRAFEAHPGGVSSLSWSPTSSPTTLATGPAATSNPAPPRCRLATCGGDGSVSLWRSESKAKIMDFMKKQEDLTDDSFRGEVRDVVWRPNIGIPSSQLAACTDQGCIAIWIQDMEGQPWRIRSSWRVSGDARRLSWSSAGVLLGVSIGDSDTALFREGKCGEWEQVSRLDN